MVKYETELFEPVKRYLEAKGFEVYAEVKNCDIVAKQGDRLLMLEMKRSFNISLVYQLMAWKDITPEVYAVVPRPKSYRDKTTKNMLKLAKKLGVGIITVAIDSDTALTELMLEPTDEVGIANTSRRRRKAAVIKELEGRSCDCNIGGSTGRKLVTAYREASVAVACYGEVNSVILTKLLSSRYKKIPQTNFYGWFTKTGRGEYILNERGKAALNDAEISEVVAYYRKEVNKCLK
jgi:hypothetical protein